LRKYNLAKLKIYCRTIRRADLSYFDQVQSACAGGVDMLEFFDAGLSARETLQTGQKLKEICAQHNIPFIIGARPDIALALDADGISLGQDDIPLSWARQILGGRKLVVSYVDSLGQALSAAKEGASYVMVGPLFSAQGKSGEPRGADIIRLIKERVKLPVFAYGGVNASNISEVIKAGADGVSVSKALCGSDRVESSARELRDIINSLQKA